MKEEHKKKIDSMTQYELCKLWRFSSGNVLFQGDTGKYFSKVLSEKGGFTSQISKSLGWKNGA